MKLLSLSIITYNRPEHIKEYLEHIINPTKEKDIDIYIYDGSSNNKTEKVVESFGEAGYKHIRYFHYGSSVRETRQRMMNAMQCPDSQYVWLCGDKFIVNPVYYDIILDHVKRDFDMITIYNSALNGTQYFDDPVKYLEYSVVPFTHYGATIVKKDILVKDIKKEYLEYFPGFARMRYLIDSINKPDFKGVTLHLNNLRIITKYSTRSESESQMWDIWIKQWYKMISSLPKQYECVKNKLYSQIDYHMHFFSLKKLMKQRSEQQFDLKKCILYHRYVKQVVLLPYIVVLIVSMLPINVADMLQFYIKDQEI